MPKVSVIIPVYNVEKYLRECLDSVINQTLGDIEIICVNDCSPDNSLGILNEYASKDSRIKIINFCENKGPGVARNTALDTAQGEYIMFLDPDDWYELDACEIAYNQITQNQNDIVMFNYQEYLEEEHRQRLRYDTISPFLPICNNPKIKFSDMDINWVKNAHTWHYIYNREFLNKNNIKYGQQHLCEDVIFMVKSTALAQDLSVIVKPLYNYRKRSEETNQSSKNFLWKDLITTREDALEFIQNCQLDKKARMPYILYIVKTLLYWFRVFALRPNFKYKKEFYEKIREIFIKLEKEYQFLNNNDAILKKDLLKKFIQKPYSQYIADLFIKNIFAIGNDFIHGTKCKVVTLFGIKCYFTVNKR